MIERGSTYSDGGEREQPLIRNCRFAFRCHQQWQSLEQTADPAKRYCHECSRDVVLCGTDEQLRAALQANECVAIKNPKSYPRIHTVGILVPAGRAWRTRNLKEESSGSEDAD